MVDSVGRSGLRQHQILGSKNTVEYNNIEYMGVDMTNKYSTLGAAHVNLEDSGRERVAFTMAVH